MTAETVAAWERGEGSPTYPQLETLAYEIYKRPLALFFFPEPPVEKTPKQDFRTLPEPEIQRLSPRMRYWLRQAQSMQLNLAELYDGVNPAEHQMVRDLKLAPDASISEMATNVRQYLNVELSDQLQWKSAEEGFKTWRNALEDCGVFVFKEAFRDDMVSGFCLYDAQFPVIYVNSLVRQQERLQGKPVADPFVIAKAKVHNGCVITQEVKKPNAARIPNVCEHFGVDCLNLEGFMEREDWTF